MCTSVADAVQAKDAALSAVTVRGWIRDKLLNTAKKVNNPKPNKKEVDGKTLDTGGLCENVVILPECSSGVAVQQVTE